MTAKERHNNNHFADARDRPMGEGTVTARVEEIRRETIGLLNNLAQKSREFDLARFPGTMERCRQKLADNTYKVLVIGEAKRGKSTFVNALIGRDILPTDVDVSTTQVFNVRPSRTEREAYRLRFEDGSEEPISLVDLQGYGSQVESDAGEEPPSLDRIIRWIEVDVPGHFLPRGVSILDTPGLGTLYSTHARITRRFVPEADAVIFVLASGQPLIQTELELIDELLKVTRNIFFVQTKIDLYSKNKWENIHHRNEKILRENFGGRLTDTRVWPISSKNLRKAGSGDIGTREAYLRVSRYEQLRIALQAFLAHVGGWSRAAAAVLAAKDYQSTSRKVLAGRLAGVTEKSKQKRSELAQDAMRRKQQFEDNWGQHGHQPDELLEAVRETIWEERDGLSKILEPGGRIAAAQEVKIESLKSVAEASQLGANMADEIVKAALDGWDEVRAQVEQRCTNELARFATAAEAASIPVEDADLRDVIVSKPANGLGNDWSMRVGNTLRFGLPAAKDLAEYVQLMALPASLYFVPVAGQFLAAASLVGVALVVWRKLSEVREVRATQLDAAKQELRVYLSGKLEEVRKRLFNDLSSNRPSPVDEYFDTLERNVSRQLRIAVEQALQQAQAEYVRQTEAAELDERRRKAQVKLIRGQLAEWDALGESINDVGAQIGALEESETAPGSTPLDAEV